MRLSLHGITLPLHIFSLTLYCFVVLVVDVVVVFFSFALLSLSLFLVSLMIQYGIWQIHCSCSMFTKMIMIPAKVNFHSSMFIISLLAKITDKGVTDYIGLSRMESPRVRSLKTLCACDLFVGQVAESSPGKLSPHVCQPESGGA